MVVRMRDPPHVLLQTAQAVALTSATHFLPLFPADFGQYVPARGVVGFQVPDAEAYAARGAVPSLAVALNDLTQSRLSYDLRVWALSPGGDASYSPFRSYSYSWASALTPGGLGGGGCLYVGVGARPQSDNLSPDSCFTPGSPDSPCGRAAYVGASALHGAYLRWALAAANSSAASDAYIRPSLAALPPVVWLPATGPGSNSAPNDRGSAALPALLWPLFTMFVLPLVAMPVSSEKAEGLWASMALAGVRRGPYLAGHYFFGVALFVPLAALLLTAGFLSGAAGFTNAGPGLWAALLLSWAHAQAAWGLLLGAALPSSPYVAAIAGYFVILAVSLANFLLTLLLQPWPRGLAWVPLLSYARAGTLILSYGGARVPASSELAAALSATALEGVAALLLAGYLHGVLRGPDNGAGTPEPWDWPSAFMACGV